MPLFVVFANYRTEFAKKQFIFYKCGSNHLQIDKNDNIYFRTAPYILDPAFPYHNLIRQKSGGIDDKYVHLERDAKKILRVLKQQRLANDGHSEL